MSIGVLYAKNGQILDEEMYANQTSSPAFEEFLSCLGDKIILQGWRQYNGGLDVIKNSTGTHSYYTIMHDIQIMFHVSTMLPYFDADPQQLERKRHLGNDICVIIFVDGKTPLQPSAHKSHFNHVFCCVQPDITTTETRYKVGFAYKQGVNTPDPPLINPPIIKRGAELRSYLLTKLINAERGAYLAPGFAKPIAAMRKQHIDELIQEYCNKATPL